MKSEIVLLILVAIMASCSKLVDEKPGHGGEQIDYDVPGTIVNHSLKRSEIYLGSPSIVVLEDGSYLVSHDESGPGTTGRPNVTRIYKSYDKGETWTRTSSIETGQTWSGLFLHENEIYLMGTKGPTLDCYIRKSVDGGLIWSEPSDRENGKLLSWKCHTSSVPVVSHKGRLWRAMEVKNPDNNIWPQKYNAMIMSMDVNDDPLKASSWTVSNQLPFDSRYLGGLFGGWLEGNAVPAPDGSMKLIMRVEIPTANQGEYIAIIDVSEDGNTISFDPESGFVKMPGGAKKFCIKYDDVSGRYWTLSNYVKPEYKGKNPGTVRNTLALCSSQDLYDWTMHKFVLEHNDVEYHGFQYVDWQIEDDDIVFVSRTAYDDEDGGADSAHNSNYITFHRIEGFREMLSESIEY